MATRTPAEPLVRVAIPAPLYTLFDYLPPEGVDAEELSPGVRLKVPFGRGVRIGILVSLSSAPSTSTPARLKRIEAVLDASPLLPPECLSLLMWAATYYRYPPGEVLCAALPARLRQGKKILNDRPKGLRLTPLGGSEGAGERVVRAPRQAQLLARFTPGQILSEETLRAFAPAIHAPLKGLIEKGLVERVEQVDPAASSQPPAPGPTLNPEQRQATECIVAALGGYAAILLDGVTGSGKTEVYLSAIQRVLEGGGQILVLVPEIGLAPQLLERFLRRLSAPVAILHSGLSSTERERAWHQARHGVVRVLIGTRSAIFTPLPRLALIIVDEEHDLSYKQQEGFRYSARDLAVVRAKQRHCPVLLGSATPALESLHNASSGRYQSIRLLQRAGGAQLPRFELIDIRRKALVAGLSPSLRELVQQTVADGAQVLLFLNRRGYAPLMVCQSCGWFSQCRRCDARMTLHLDQGILWCHHCGAQRRPDTRCPQCNTATITPAGLGTERLERELNTLFPQIPIVRIDRDSTSRKGSFERRLEEIQSGQHSILVGTQMLSKGHHFPNVTLVGILDIDQGFYGIDYHATERMAQAIVQVAGRAGRAERPGRVVLQTRHPDHPLLYTLIRKGYPAFAREALQERSLAGLPPFSCQALFRAEAKSPEPPKHFLEAVREALLAASTSTVEVLGPVPAPMERRAGHYRAHLLVQAPNRQRLQQLLEVTMGDFQSLRTSGRVRWSVDVDPMEMA